MKPTLIQVKSKTRKEYVARINRVIDYIGSNLHKPLDLEKLAGVAAFSPFHFHRIFRAMVGEGISEYINRLRLERAASRVRIQPEVSITEIALDCGFSSSSHFARAFKRHFGVSATRYREMDGTLSPPGDRSDQISKMGQINSKNGIANRKQSRAFSPLKGYEPASDSTNPNQRRTTPMNVEVKNLPGYRVAYVRVMDGYNSEKIKPAFEKIITWAGARDFLGPDTLVLGISLDNPEVTPADKCRYDACVTVPADTRGDGEIGVYDIAGGKYAICRVEGDYADINAQLSKAWNKFLGGWFPDSGYQPDDRPCFEVYRETREQAEAGKFIVDICEPVKPL
jgi:AraC family transcriptional regulator